MKKLGIILIALLFIRSQLSGEGLSMSIWGRTVLNLLWFSSAGNPALGYQPGVIYSKWGPDMNASMYGNDGMYMNINWDGPLIGYHLGFQFSNWDIFGDIASANPAGPVPPTPTQGFGSRVTTLFGSAKIIPDALSLKIGLIKAAGSYILPDELSKYPMTFDLASITWKLDPFVFKIGGQFYSDMNNSSPIIAYRGAAEINYSLGDFCLMLWGDISNEFAHTYIEGGPVIQYKPICTKVGFIFKQFTYRNGGSSSDYEWSLPFQIDIGF